LHALATVLGFAGGLIAGGVTVALLAAAAGFVVAAASGLFDSLLDTFSLVERGEKVKKCIH
jgi:biopolymer transport protein ExbB/TolQ